MDLAPKSTQKLLIKGGEFNKIYVPQLKTIHFWLLYRKITAKKSTIVKNMI